MTARLWLVAAALSVATGCGTLSQVYVQPNYSAVAGDAVVHVKVVAYAPAQAEDLAPVMAAVLADLVKLRKNYLVVAAAPFSASDTPCGDGVQGVLVYRALDVTAPKPNKVGLRGALELHRCHDGAMVYRAEGYRATRSNEKSLADLVATYTQQLDGRGAKYAAPAFALAQALVEPMPDPQLTDAQIEEKIELGELGGLGGLDEAIAALTQLHKSRRGIGACELLQHARVVGP